jgi:hypothetical protein
MDKEPIANVTLSQSQAVEETLEDRKKQFEGKTILDMIDFYVANKLYINVGKADYRYDRWPGYFQFLSRESIRWYRDTSGYRFFPYLHIIDENNLRLELFVYLGLAEEAWVGRYCSAHKIYIDISTDQLIEYYLQFINPAIKRPAPIETYVATPFFNINVTEDEFEKRGYQYQFDVPKEVPVYETAAMQGEPQSMALAGSIVKVIDMHYQDLNDRYPVAVKVEISGWVDVDSLDFIKKDQ